MSVCAYILIETEPGKSRDVARATAAITGVASAFAVTGPYDVVAAIDLKHQELVTKIVLPAIQTIPGVKKTITCLREDLA